MKANLMLGLAAAAVLGAAIFDAPATAQSAGKPRAVSVDLALAKTGKPLEREALITLKDSEGKPVSEAEVEIMVDMPSMPMMHQVPKALAEPAAQPGTYRTRFTLEMAGEWAAHIEIKKPVRTRAVKKFVAD